MAGAKGKARRRVEDQATKVAEKGIKKKAAASTKDREAFAKRMTERQVDFYRSVVEEDCSRMFFTEELMPYHPLGVEGARAHNDMVTEAVRDFKEFAAARLAEHEEKGYLPGFPPAGEPADVLKRLLSGK